MLNKSLRRCDIRGAVSIDRKKHERFNQSTAQPLRVLARFPVHRGSPALFCGETIFGVRLRQYSIENLLKKLQAVISEVSREKKPCIKRRLQHPDASDLANGRVIYQ